MKSKITAVFQCPDGGAKIILHTSVDGTASFAVEGRTLDQAGAAYFKSFTGNPGVSLEYNFPP